MSARVGADDFVAAGASRADVEALPREDLSPPTTDADRDLHQRVRAVMLADKVPAFDKRRQVTELVLDALRRRGDFCRTQDGRLFFFSRPERRLYDLEQRPFQHLLTALSGLSVTESGFRFVLDVLQATTARRATLVVVHTLAHYDVETSALAISDGGGGVWIRERGGPWTLTHNGDGELLFFTEPDAHPWVPEFRGTPDALDWFLGRFLLADRPLSREDQRALLLVTLLQQFFPALRRTRMIPAFLGPQGAGKTSGARALGMLLVGPRFDVTGLHRDREDAFVAAVTNRVICALDNADSRIPWLDDALATYATGLRYRLRRLYTTNEEVAYEPRAMLVISSRDPHFNRPDVAERLLPLYFERPERYEAEGALWRALDARRGDVWGALLARLSVIADALPTTREPALGFRMADYAVFGWRLFQPLGQAGAWEALLQRLEAAQASFATDGDGVVAALRTLLDRDGPLDAVDVAELFRRCRTVAQAEGFPFPRTAQGFGRRLSSRRRVIELELSVRFQEDRGRGGRRWVSLTPYRPSGDEGGEGGDVGGKVSDSEGTS